MKRLSTRTRSDKQGGNGFKLKEAMFKSDIREKLFVGRVVRNFLRLTRETVEAQSLKMFKAKLDGVLSNLV